ncbi:hypothetical protein HMPREF1082_00670 [[Clostridium] clostridioforme 90A7]|nr:hypothetical protein HMPREF1082_00670 [[Clostridium] clostridioforme 90A7]
MSLDGSKQGKDVICTNHVLPLIRYGFLVHRDKFFLYSSITYLALSAYSRGV